MDSSSSASAPTFTLPNLTQFVFIKLEGPNYLPWTTQLAPILKTHELMGIVDGSEPCPPQFLLDAEGKEVLNPAYTIWQKKDQYVLSWINVHLSESVIYGLQTSQQVWTSLATKFASSTRSHVSHLKRQLQTLKQGSKSCSDCLKTAIHTDLWLPQYLLWVVANTTSFSSMIFQDTHGFTLCTINLRHMTILLSSNFWLKINSLVKFINSNLMGVENSIPQDFKPFSPTMAFCIEKPALNLSAKWTGREKA
jgi:hypothetical protein